MSKGGEGAVMPRIPSSAYFLPFESHHSRPGRGRILCGGALSDEIHDALL